MAQSPSTAPTPGTTARTRRAILDAAVTALVEDRLASLTDVARAAGVGRSTLHRYFPDRAALLRALADDTREATQRAFEEAALDQGPPREAFRRMVRAFFELGPRMSVLFSELPDDAWDEAEWESAHDPVAALFVRGQAAGAFDPETDGGWFVRCLWHLSAAGWQAMEEESLPRHQALENVTRTLERGLLT